MKNKIKIALLLLAITSSGCATTYEYTGENIILNSINESGKGKIVPLSSQVMDKGTRWCQYRERFTIYMIKAERMTTCPRDILLK